MLLNIFSSNVRVELLSVFFLNPEREIYVREAERIIGHDRQNVIRELRNLEGIGLLYSRRQGNLKYYGLNRSFIIFDELKSIFMKTRGVVSVITQSLSGMPDIDYAFIYGSYANGTERETSDIDVMVVGTITLDALLRRLREPEALLGRDVNPSLYGRSEVEKRMKEKDEFISGVITGPKIMLIGNEDELRRACT